jgi:hypothetical protein
MAAFPIRLNHCAPRDNSPSARDGTDSIFLLDDALSPPGTEFSSLRDRRLHNFRAHPVAKMEVLIAHLGLNRRETSGS